MLNKKNTKSMLHAVISLVIILLITSFVSGSRFRLIQHRTTRKEEARDIPRWLDSMIEFFSFPLLIWKSTSLIGVILFSVRLCQIGRYELIIVSLLVATFILLVGYICSALFTSKVFSKKNIRSIRWANYAWMLKSSSLSWRFFQIKSL